MPGKADDGLRKLILNNAPLHSHLTPIETGGVRDGVPDLHYQTTLCSGWIECKAMKGWTPKFRPLQIGWIARQLRAGGRVHVAVRRHGSAVREGSYDYLYLVNGYYAQELSEMGIRDVPMDAIIAVWEGGPKKWDWPAFWSAVAVPLG